MTGHFDFLKKYFSDAAWQRLKQIREDEGAPLIPSAWTELLTEGAAFTGQDLRGEAAQAWAARCHEAWQTWTTDHQGIQLGFAKAWEDYRNWPKYAQLEVQLSDFEAALALAKKAQAYRRLGYYERWKQLRQF